MIRRIFISSTQRELAEERKAIVDCVSANPQLARFFSTFAFEFDVPVQDKRTDEVYLAELASSDIFEHCASHGLEPPIFDVDARHVSVTVIRPTFDENGRKVGQKNAEVRAKGTEVGQKMAEVGAKGKKLGAKPAEVGANGEEVRTNFDSVMANYRKDFRETCFKVWQLLREDSSLTQRDVYPRLQLAYSSVQSAYNALQEVGLLHREGRGRGAKWIVMSQPIQPITNAPEPITKEDRPCLISAQF